MNAIKKALSAFRDFVFLATRNWISATGVVLATFAAISFLIILAMSLTGAEEGNYRGIISYIILPTIFVIGLVLIPIGLRQLKKREKAGQPTSFPVLNFNDPRLRTMTLVVFALTVLNLMIISVATYKALNVMHSDRFCGTTCHNVMQPEAVAHQQTMHSNVYCADCHIGEGASHFAKAKLNGARQMGEFIVGDFSRPVPQPVPISSAICMRCHATERFGDDRVIVRKSYGDGEKAVEKTTVLRMIVGGFRDGKWHGVHQHNGMKVRYFSDQTRTNITQLEVTRPDGTSEKYALKDAKAPAEGEWTEMGCTDCHSRPAHRFWKPETVVDRAIARGAIDKDLPFIKREALAAIKASYPSHQAALKELPAALQASYAKVAPGLDAAGKAKVDAAGKVLAEEWTHNNFPDMKVGWGTYRDFFQHDPGCFRCHDSKMVNAKGDAMQQRCSGACHEVIASEEEKPEILDILYP